MLPVAEGAAVSVVTGDWAEPPIAGVAALPFDPPLTVPFDLATADADELASSRPSGSATPRAGSASDRRRRRVLIGEPDRSFPSRGTRRSVGAMDRGFRSCSSTARGSPRAAGSASRSTSATRGFAVSAPEWPRKHGDVEQLRDDAEELAGLGLRDRRPLRGADPRARRAAGDRRPLVRRPDRRAAARPRARTRRRRAQPGAAEGHPRAAVLVAQGGRRPRWRIRRSGTGS